MSRTLSVVSLGHVHTEAIEPLAKHLTRLEQVMTSLAPRAELDGSRAEINRAIDAAANDWVLILRERETVDEPLAAEIAQSLDGAAWGYRVRTVPLYAGTPLRLGGDAELRLVHRRHLLRREWMVEGSVIRLHNPLLAVSFASAEEHREYLAKLAVPQSALRRMLIFLRNARTFDRNTLKYLWIEAGFDHGDRRPATGDR